MAEQKVKLTQLPEATNTIDTAVLLVNQNETDQRLPVTHFLRAKNNLLELENTAQARANLGVPSVEDVNDKVEYLIDGKSTFLNGATLESERDFIWDKNSKSWYYWTGAFSKEVPAASTPESTGGIGAGKWLSVGDAVLRSDLAKEDGEKLIGTCPDIATLRTIEPDTDEQRITLKQHTAGTGLGGGQFRSVVNGASYSDNNGTIIKTAGGAAWLRLNADVTNPLMFGAKGDGIAIDITAINNAIASSSQTDLLGRTYAVSGGAIQVYNVNPCTVYNGTITEPAVTNTTMMRVSGKLKTIRDIKFDGANGISSRGITFNSGSDSCLITRCQFYNLKMPAIGLSGDYTNNVFCRNIILDKNVFNNCGNSGTGFDRNTIIVDGAIQCTISNNIASNCNWGVFFRKPYTYPALTETYCLYNKVTGNYFSAKGGYPYNQCISAQSQRHFEVSGNSIEGFLGNGIDNQRCDYSRITNNRINSGDDGVFFGDLNFRGHVVSDNVITGCNRGIRIYGLAAATESDFKNQIMSSLVISNNIIIDSKYVGIYVYRTEPTDTFTGFNISNNVVDNSGSRTITTQAQAILVTGLSNGIVSNNDVKYSRQEGIRFVNCYAVNANGNNISGHDASNTGTYGVYIDVTSTGVMLRDTTITGGSATGGAVRETGTNNTVSGTRWNAVASGVNSTGTGAVLSDNVPF